MGVIGVIDIHASYYTNRATSTSLDPSFFYKWNNCQNNTRNPLPPSPYLLLLGIFDDILDLLGVVVQLHLTFHVKILKLDKFSSMEIINEIISHIFMINEFWLNTFGLEIVNRHHLLVATITTQFSITKYSITVHFLYPPSCKTTDADTL